MVADWRDAFAARTIPTPKRRGKYSEHDYLYGRFAASKFLDDIVPDYRLAHLRFIQLVVPPYVHYVWPQNDRDELVEWGDTIGRIRGKISLRALTTVSSWPTRSANRAAAAVPRNGRGPTS
ncbi:hypothetical protein N657DRAFT_637790 [Parathielavia appendiculata]|uniref:Uncharacterized protein n=1 Tax=Parathielavia appendiculata TaxID=2587402 RepID=A0AAN6TQE4_9PEZI|nr:hypothetical protein N657DRAFT_637790 [Parathielavia appendiculata]